jgi:hypothetical protein
MTVFILPKTILHTPTVTPSNNVEVSLNEYIKRFNRLCVHECVPYSMVIHDLLFKYNLNNPVTYTSELVGVHPVVVNHTDHINDSVFAHIEKGGTYISKISDSTSYESIQWLFKLSSCFKTVNVCKPDCICNISSIKYVIAIDFHHVPLSGHFDVPNYFKNCIDEMNSTFGQTQLEHLRFSKK